MLCLNMFDPFDHAILQVMQGVPMDVSGNFRLLRWPPRYFLVPPDRGRLTHFRQAVCRWSWFSDLLRQLKSFQGWKPKMDQNQIHQPTKSHEFRQWQAHFDAFFSSYSVVYNHLGYMSIRRNTSRSMALGGSARHVLCESIKSTICGIYWLELVWLDRTWSTRNLNLYGIDKNLSINPSGWLWKGYIGQTALKMMAYGIASGPLNLCLFHISDLQRQLES